MRTDLIGPTPGPRDFMTIWIDYQYLKGQLLMAEAQAVGVSKNELANMAAVDCATIEFKLKSMKEGTNGK